MENALIVALGLGIYFLPTWIGGSKYNGTSIFILNLFLGWTFVGWVVALVWATTTEKPSALPAIVSVEVDAAKVGGPRETQLQQLKMLRDKGVLTQSEFMEQVTRLTQ